MSSLDEKNPALMMNRREAIKRTAMMLGAAVSASTIAGCMGGGSEATAGANWTPQFLTKAQGKVAHALANVIFPRSDTPGAVDVGVPQLMDLVYGKFMDDEERTLFANGLDKLSASKFGELSETEQTAAVVALGETRDPDEKAFLTKARELTITGYFTSEEVCKNVTTYDPIPGGYVACVPISETGNVIMSEPR
jgi:gluconate 2-dehydrogenase gamma chain